MEKQKVPEFKVENIKENSLALQIWFNKNKRVLPWRMSKNPYAIWISETMLQQTTTQAVRPYFERFLAKFPDLKTLAMSSQESVLEAWAGLGYYSRARNLHLAAQQMYKSGIPKNHIDWLTLPGVGPYTARAVSSLAFGEDVGVLDGNVIRILSRMYGIKAEWWKTADRKLLQNLSDQMVSFGESSVVNQAMMELGALVCTPKSPSCMSCPVAKRCVALKADSIPELPLRKKPQERIILQWSPFVVRKLDQVALIQNTYSPFLKGQMLFPGQCEVKKTKPKSFRFVHYITQYDIYVTPQVLEPKRIKALTSVKWVKEHQLKSVNPSSLLQKVLLAVPAERAIIEGDLHG
jgi:A/G-specific adenine glycosylase